ncbi:hypothetical protein ACIG5E_32855 [Kitasatospora sp. NPDC053057]|uniref:hypothetical protein n=1 Tax=Kitasatospora sp. NPDC053057 TaxID=3364062 RepID=UPI0037CC455A
MIWSLLRHEYYAVLEDMRRADPGFVMPDAVPEKDKAEARRIVADYMTSTAGETSARILLERVAGESPRQAARAPRSRVRHSASRRSAPGMAKVMTSAMLSLTSVSANVVSSGPDATAEETPVRLRKDPGLPVVKSAAGPESGPLPVF